MRGLETEECGSVGTIHSSGVSCLNAIEVNGDSGQGMLSTFLQVLFFFSFLLQVMLVRLDIYALAVWA